MMKNTLLISLAIILFFSCKEKTAKNTETNKDTITTIPDTAEVYVGDTLTYEFKGYNKQIEGCANENTNCAIFVASFPVLDAVTNGTKVADAINNFVRGKLYSPLIGDEQPNGLNDLLRPYFEAYKEALQTNQNEGEDSIVAWKFDRKILVHTNTFKVFTLEHSESSYAGGAHPNSFTNYYHFSPESGEQLKLANFFNKGFKSQLTSIAEKEFRRQLSINPNTSLEDEGFWFKDKVFSLNENFWRANDGIHFLYNPYEVAAYAVGAIEITISYNTINDLLKEEYKPRAL